MDFLRVSGINKDEQGNFIVKNTSFTLDRFQRTAIAGETGSGKTTLLRMIAGWIQPASGTIHFKGKRILGPQEQLLPGHPGIAYLSQHFELRNNYWVYEELEAMNKLPAVQSNTIYSICRIDHLLKRRTNQLSGGEKQRIALARLLTTSPELLLLDEPFSNLDLAHKKIMWAVIRDISHTLGITCLMVLHDASDILSWADTIMVLQQGEIIRQGSPEELYKQPGSVYTAALFGEYNIWREGSGQVLIRPENIHLHRDKGEKIAVVRDILFKGSHYLIEVMIDRQLLKVQSLHNHFTTGERVFVSWDAAKTATLPGV
jgi:ABC-type Fe3+/spermidine/putrescine transport system ATPase subunit